MTFSELTVDDTLSYGSFREVIPSLLFLVLLFFLNFTSRIIFSPLLPVIESELNVNHAVSGSFFLFISSGYVLSILLSGFVSKRINHKRTIVCSAIGAGVVLLFLGMSTTLFQLRFALFCLGLSAGLYLPSALTTITRMVSPSYWARGMAVHELAPNIGFVAAPLLGQMMLYFVPWRQGIFLFGLILIITGLCYFMFAEGCRERGRPLDMQIVSHILKMADFWILTLLFSLAICSTVGVFAMLPLFLVLEHGMEMEKANGLVAVSRVAAIGMPIAAGWLGDRFGNRPVMVLVLLIGGLLTVFLGLCPGWLLIVPVILQPMITVCFFPSGFAILSKMGPPGVGNVGVSLVIPLAFLIGAGVMPTLIGLIGDQLSIGAGLVGAGFMMLLGGVAPFFVSFTQNRSANR